MNEMYKTANIPSIPTCEQGLEEIPVKETRGLYDISQATYECLCDILVVLNAFKDEIEFPTEKHDFEFKQPSSFSENINKNNDLAFAIRGDLNRLICKFRG